MANKSIPLPIQVEGTQFEKFDQLFRTVIAVPKSVIDKEEKKWKRARVRKKRAKKP
jgi:U3 small nucleolar ribonucleoprotein component